MSDLDAEYATLGHSIFIATFQRTGCPNKEPPHGLLEKWRDLTDEQAWGEMYAYCIEALHGTGVLIQCCGWDACRPSQCIMQNKWSATAADPTTSAAPTTHKTTRLPSTTTVIATTAETRRRSQPSSTSFAGGPDSCAVAFTACECAARKNCGWRWTRECYFVGWPNSVSCTACPSQSHCATDSCNKWLTPCLCASSAPSCSWDPAQGTCASGIFGTSCTSCPSQTKCVSQTNQNEPVPLEVVAFDPPNGGSLQAATAQINLEFNIQMDWCSSFPDGFPASTRGVTFGCDNLNPVQIYRQNLKRQDEGLRLRIDLSDLLKQVPHRATGCGLRLPPGLICGADGNPTVFQGQQRDQYSFSLVAGTPPFLLSFQPKNQATNVALDGKLTLTFDQNVILKEPPDQVAGLTMIDSYDRALKVNDVGLRLKPPEAMVDGTRLILMLAGKVQAGSRYTLSLPGGAVRSTSGNQYAGLWASEYTFETVTAKKEGGITNSGSSDGSISSSTMILMAGLAGGACIFAVGVLAVWMACRMFLSKSFTQPSKRRVYPDDFSHVRKPSGVSAGTPVNVGWHHQPTYGKPSESWAHHSERCDAAEPRRMAYSFKSHDNMWSHQHVAAGTLPRSSSWHQQQHHPHSAETRNTRGPAAATRSSSAGPKFVNQESAPPKSGNRSSGPSHCAAQRMPAKEALLCPEAKAVEARLRELMNESLSSRKKILKELLVEYHPDRNNTQYAKEVFQFVNNAREWFLVDT